jgi:hypothetical protein
VLSPQLVELGSRATAPRQERFGEGQPALSPVLPQSRFPGQALVFGGAPEPLQALKAVLSMFLVMHDVSLNWDG